MKKLIVNTFVLMLFVCMGKAQTLTEVILPQYMYGNGATGYNIVPFVYRAKISGLTAGATYRYNNLAILAADDQSKAGAGASHVVREGADFTRNISTTSLSGAATGTLTADANGDYTGWFVLEPTGVKYTPGNELLMQINLGGAGGTPVVSKRLYTTNTVKVLNWGTGTVNNATAIRSTAALKASAKNFVMLYDKEKPAATDRPISGAVVESDGLDVSAVAGANSYDVFYTTSVNGTDKAWGTLIPNNLADGIRCITRYSFDGSQAGYNTSSDGSWDGASGAVSTVNASGANSAVLVLDGGKVTLDVPAKESPELTFAVGFPVEVLVGDADFSAGVTSKSDAAITYSSSNELVATINASGVVHITGSGTTEIKAVQAENATYAADTAARSLLVKVPKTTTTLTFSTTFPSSVIIGSENFNAGVSSNSPAVITYNSSNATVATINENGLIHITGLGSTVITVSQPETDLYTAATVTQTLTVVDKPVPVVTFLPFSARIYGDMPFDLTASATSGAAVQFVTDNPSVAKIADGRVQVTGAGTANITAVFPATATYAAATASQVLTVQKKPLSVIAEDKNRKQGEANPALTVRYIGFVNGDTNTTALQTQPLLTTAATATSVAGVYAINVSGAASANYDIAYVSGNIVVEAVLLENTIAFSPISTKVYGQADFEAGAVSSSGLPVTYSSDNAAVASVSGTRIHITGAGSAIITASQPGNATYLPATSVTRTLTVKKALLAVTTRDTSKIQGAANPGFTLLYDGFVNNDNESVLISKPVVATSAIASSPAAVYPVVVSGGAADNYDLIYVNGKLTVYPAAGAGNDELTGYCDAPGRLKISVLVQAVTKASIQLYDASGKKVADMAVTMSKGFNVYHIDVSRLSAGVYPLRVVGGDLLLKSKVFIR